MGLRADRQGTSGPGFNLLGLRSEFAVAGDCRSRRLATADSI